MKEKEIKKLKNFIKRRITENKRLFNKKELKLIKENENCIEKVYLLGFVNSRDCYKK